MIIADSLDSNTIRFIPRNGTPYRVNLVDEQTKEEINVDGTFVVEDYYTVVDIDETLVEGRRYRLTIYTSSILDDQIDNEVLYRDILFVTTQDQQTYSSHNNKYKEPEISSGRKYKII